MSPERLDPEQSPEPAGPQVVTRGNAGRRRGTKERILEAAGSLLYHEGLRATGVDAIAERAGVAKRTLYKHFRSKDDLIEAYLRKLDESSRQTFEFLMGDPKHPAEQRVANLFRHLGSLVTNVRWKGCGFAKAAVELAGLPGHPAVKVARDHKNTFERWLTDALDADEVPGSEKLARRLMVLIDGVITLGIIHHDAAIAREAKELALELIAAARQGSGHDAARRRWARSSLLRSCGQ